MAGFRWGDGRHRRVLPVLVGGGLVCAACSSTHPSSRSSATARRSAASSASSGSSPSRSTSGSGSGSTSTASCLASATPAAAGASAPAVDAIELVTPTVGWAAGAGRILHTTDGGAQWTVQLTSSLVFGDVDFLSSQTGWAVGDQGLLGTTDGGGCWVQLGEPAVGPLRTVHFVSPSVGFGVAGGTFSLEPAGSSSSGSTASEGFVGAFAPVDPRQGGVLVATTDGGRSWHTVADAPANAQSVCFVSASTGWLGAGGGVYETTDGTAQWKEVADPGASSGAAPNGNDIAGVDCGAPSDVWLTSDTGGAAAGNSPWAVFVLTSSSGARLLAADMYPGVTAAPDPTPGTYPGPVSVIGNGVAAVAGFTPAAPPPRTVEAEVLDRSDQLLEPPQPVPDLGEVSGLAFISADDGWIVGMGTHDGTVDSSVGVIEHTTDGGAHWTVQDTVDG
jgi:photosystem II stability/assembly factor-like uncharacterized protein